MTEKNSKTKRAIELRNQKLTWTVIAIRLGYSSPAAARKAVKRYDKKNG